MKMSLKSSSVAISLLGLLGGDLGLLRGLSRREPASETTRLLSLDSRAASRNSRRYSSPPPLEKGNGVTRSGLRLPELIPELFPDAYISIHESVDDGETTFFYVEFSMFVFNYCLVIASQQPLYLIQMTTTIVFILQNTVTNSNIVVRLFRDREN